MLASQAGPKNRKKNKMSVEQENMEISRGEEDEVRIFLSKGRCKSISK